VDGVDTIVTRAVYSLAFSPTNLDFGRAFPLLVLLVGDPSAQRNLLRPVLIAGAELRTEMSRVSGGSLR